MIPTTISEFNATITNPWRLLSQREVLTSEEVRIGIFEMPEHTYFRSVTPHECIFIFRCTCHTPPPGKLHITHFTRRDVYRDPDNFRRRSYGFGSVEEPLNGYLLGIAHSYTWQIVPLPSDAQP